MDLLLFSQMTAAFALGMLTFTVCKIIFLKRKFRADTERLLDKQEELILEIERLKAVAVQKKEVLSIEAQQLLHDMTAHGQAIVRIVPISPTDIFWRSPR